MMPHPSTANAVAELRRQDLLIDAHLQRLAALAVGPVPGPSFVSPRWLFGDRAVFAMRSLLRRGAEISIHADARRSAAT